MPKIVTKCKTCGKVAAESERTLIPNLNSQLIKLACGHFRIEKLAHEAPAAVAKPRTDATDATACPVCRKALSFGSIDAATLTMRCKTCNESHTFQMASVTPSDRDPHWHATYKYQKESTKFIERANFNCLLADPAGMGKTIEALAGIRYSKNNLTPTLFVVKSKLRYQWAREIIKWLAPTWEADPRGVNIPIIINTKDDLIIPGMYYYIVSMDLLPKIYQRLELMGFKLLVVDESQNFKNTSTGRTKALQSMAKVVPHKIFISGTPIMNTASEYFPVLNMLRPESWPSKESFGRTWCSVDYARKRYSGLKPYRRDEFFSRTKDYILRRKREDYFDDLPAVENLLTILEINRPEFVAAYERQQKELADYLRLAEDQGMGGFESYGQILAMLTKLREIAGVAKVESCAELIESMLEENPDEKILVGIHHKSVAGALLAALTKYNPATISGGMSEIESNHQLHKFQKNDTCKVMVASTIAAGEGLDGLQLVCSQGIVLERQWNSAREQQFTGRIHRNLQTKPVQMNYLIAKGSIDEWMSNLIEKKRSWIDSADSTVEMTSDGETFSVDWKELAQMSAKRKIK